MKLMLLYFLPIILMFLPFGIEAFKVHLENKPEQAPNKIATILSIARQKSTTPSPFSIKNLLATSSTTTSTPINQDLSETSDTYLDNVVSSNEARKKDPNLPFAISIKVPLLTNNSSNNVEILERKHRDSLDLFKRPIRHNNGKNGGKEGGLPSSSSELHPVFIKNPKQILKAHSYRSLPQYNKNHKKRIPIRLSMSRKKPHDSNAFIEDQEKSSSNIIDYEGIYSSKSFGNKNLKRPTTTPGGININININTDTYKINNKNKNEHDIYPSSSNSDDDDNASAEEEENNDHIFNTYLEPNYVPYIHRHDFIGADDQYPGNLGNGNMIPYNNDEKFEELYPGLSSTPVSESDYGLYATSMSNYYLPTTASSPNSVSNLYKDNPEPEHSQPQVPEHNYMNKPNPHSNSDDKELFRPEHGWHGIISKMLSIIHSQVIPNLQLPSTEPQLPLLSSIHQNTYNIIAKDLSSTDKPKNLPMKI